MKYLKKGLKKKEEDIKTRKNDFQSMISIKIVNNFDKTNTC